MAFHRSLFLITDPTGSWLKVPRKFASQICPEALYEQLLLRSKGIGTYLFIDATGSGTSSPAHQFLRHLQQLHVPYQLSHEPPRYTRSSRIHSLPASSSKA